MDQPVPTLPSLLDKTYFMSKEAWVEFERNNSKQEQGHIGFPPLRPIDVFAMLACHYPPHQDDSGRRVELLAAVIDSDYVEITDQRAISTEMAMFRGLLKADILAQGDATYQRRRHRTSVDRDVRLVFAEFLDELETAHKEAPDFEILSVLINAVSVLLRKYT
jgi:hypothetical protein